jgi:DNA polymerase/3'-5' exonuclease PolX
VIELSFDNFYKHTTLLAEGGNIFSDRRIQKSEVLPTLKHLEKLTGLSLVDNTLGSTGKAESSGDIDVVIDSNLHSKDKLIKDLITKGEDPTHMKKTGIEVAYKGQIIDAQGNPTEDYVQVDFMFHDDPEYLKFYYDNNEKAPYKGAHRNITLASIAKTKGYSLSMKGLADRETKQIVTKDPEELAKRVLGEDATKQDLFNLPSIISYLRKHHTNEEIEAMVQEAEKTIGLRVI